ncbi:hypothetical protein VTI74DRAFT_7673 [Chaetomium olivicolor]
MTESMPAASLTRPCVKCRTQEATLDSRSQPVCRDCFTKFIATKCVKQIGLLGKETRPPPSTTGGPPTGTRRYLLGLSFGVSSTVLLHLLNENVEFQLAKGRNAPFELVVVHIDTSDLTQTSQLQASEAEEVLNRYRGRYPRFTFHYVPLTSALARLDLSALPRPPTTSTQPCSQDINNHPTATLQALLSSLQTPASRTDILRLLTRRTLLSLASPAQHNCSALLLGHSTTALAELTLSEAAKGRGFALPWLINDGPALLSATLNGDGDGDNNVAGDGNGVGHSSGERGDGKGVVLVYHPLRDALRKELVTYAGLVEPPLTELIPSNGGEAGGNGAVVSHRDLSIEEVMTKYFAEVEEGYPSVVANVARTTGKLVRAGGEERCGLCGMPLDEPGDERWRGELGIQGEEGRQRMGTGRLCYGCERSTAG